MVKCMFDSINHLLTWCQQKGVHISEQLCLKDTLEGGICIYSKDAFINANETLVTIPANAVLSVKVSFLANEPELSGATHGIDAQLALSCVLYAEILRKEDSAWFGYLQSLPEMDLPYFWVESDDDDDSSRWLRGTRAHDLLRCAETGCLISDQVLSFFNETVKDLLCKHFKEDDVTLDGFEQAFSLVSSRAFLVDAYHGLAMVPIADAFNHTTENHVHLASEYNVCPDCGSLSECSHDKDDSLPLSKPQYSSISTQEQVCYEMVSNIAIPPSTEVFNTYGENLDDAQLFVRYGFILEDNEYNLIPFSRNDLDCHNIEPKYGSEDWLDIPTVGESQMIYYHQNEKDLWSIDAEGRISHHLWLACLPNALKESAKSANWIWEGQIAIESGSAPSKQKRTWLTKLANTIIALCRRAEENMGNGTVEEARTLLDSDDCESTRQYRALTYFLMEQSILRSCRGAWEDFRNEISNMGRVLCDG